MKLASIITALLLAFSAFALTLPDNAEAARMGGGRSFGSKPFMSAPAKPPATRQPTTNQQNPTAIPGRPGMGLMGGMLGGLLAGTLLGSLLSGHGFSGGGFLDILILAGLAFLAWRLFKRFQQSKVPAPAAAGASPLRDQSTSSYAGQGWGALRSDAAPAMSSADPHVDVPAGFDVEEFLRGAKMAYTRMQESWDKRDLEDISQFATPAIMDILKKQLADDPQPGHTELLLVNASLLGVENEGADQRAQVYFDVLMREDPSQQNPSSVREIWHFLKSGANGDWRLDGIQQVE